MATERGMQCLLKLRFCVHLLYTSVKVASIGPTALKALILVFLKKWLVGFHQFQRPTTAGFSERLGVSNAFSPDVITYNQPVATSTHSKVI